MIANLKSKFRNFTTEGFIGFTKALGSPAFKSSLPVVSLSTKHHSFFGYYDLDPFVKNDSAVLAGTCSSYSESPQSSDEMQLGLFNLESGVFTAFDRTRSWCWQQGCRLQKIPGFSRVIYNKEDTASHSYSACIRNLEDFSVEKSLTKPIYSIDPAGKLGLSLNFSRLQRLRPGYGYSFFEDQTRDDLAPERDGIFAVSLEDGHSDFLISLNGLKSFEPTPEMKEAQHYVNHLSFCSDSKRFIFFHLWKFGSQRAGRVVLSDLNGDLKLVPTPGNPSHFAWLDADQLLLTYRKRGGNRVGYFIHTLSSGSVAQVCPDQLQLDGHPTRIGKSEWVLSDTYPDSLGRQILFAFNLNSGESKVLASSLRSPLFRGEYRCDFHPRVNSSGTKICIDDIQDDRRVLRVISFDSPRWVTL